MEKNKKGFSSRIWRRYNKIEDNIIITFNFKYKNETLALFKLNKEKIYQTEDKIDFQLSKKDLIALANFVFENCDAKDYDFLLKKVKAISCWGDSMMYAYLITAFFLVGIILS